uniref:Uncharacterized protein n=1 Tax=Solanum tuberosum TaxID=4113 RepID=M1DLJ1_SOLTU
MSQDVRDYYPAMVQNFYANYASLLEKQKNYTTYMKSVLGYELTPTNFTRLAKWVDKHEKKLKLFAEKLGPFVDRALPKALYPYSNCACPDECHEGLYE